MNTEIRISAETATDDASPCYRLVLDLDGKVTEINTTLCLDLGYEAAHLPDSFKITDILSVGSRIFYQTHFFPLIKLHGSYEELYLTFRTVSGEEIPALLNAKIYESAEGKKVVCAGLKVSRRNQYEKELIAARKLAEKALEDNVRLQELKLLLEKGHEELEKRVRKAESHSQEQEQINSILSHELQEPLRKIALFSKMMLDQMTAEVPQNWKSFVSKIYHSSVKIKDMSLTIQRYLGIGERNFSSRPLDIGELIRGVIQQNQTTIGESKVVVNVSPHTPEVVGDPVLLEGLFTELLSNSVKFAHTSRGLEINIEIDSVEENYYKKIGDKYKYLQYVRIRVSDNGSGFMPKYNEEVFKLFKKMHVFDHGLGFGLAYCRKVIDLHHGEIEAKSELNHGTTITLLLRASV